VETNKKKIIEWPQANGRFHLVVATTTRGSRLLHFLDGYLELHSAEALRTRAGKGVTFKRRTARSKLKGCKRDKDILEELEIEQIRKKNLKPKKQMYSPFRHNAEIQIC
jgi:hypothetical protein